MQGILHPRTERNKKALSQKAKGWEETKEAVIIIITHSKVEILHFHSNEKEFENQTEKDFAALDLECEKHLCRNSYYDIKSLKDCHYNTTGLVFMRSKISFHGFMRHIQISLTHPTNKKEIRKLTSFSCMLRLYQKLHSYNTAGVGCNSSFSFTPSI